MVKSWKLPVKIIGLGIFVAIVSKLYLDKFDFCNSGVASEIKGIKGIKGIKWNLLDIIVKVINKMQ